MMMQQHSRTGQSTAITHTQHQVLQTSLVSVPSQKPIHSLTSLSLWSPWIPSAAVLLGPAALWTVVAQLPFYWIFG